MEKLNCEEVNRFDLVGYLSYLGHHPAKISKQDYWYHSPLRRERTPSFKVNKALNLWYDHGAGEGGTFIDFGIRYHCCNVSALLQLLSSYMPVPSAQLPPLVPASFVNQDKYGPGNIQVLQSRAIEHRLLLLYLQHRKIDLDLARHFCREVDFRLYGKNRTAIGFPNRSGGFELRSADFKGSSSPKDYSLLINAPNEKSLHLLEGFFDLLALVSLEPGLKAGNFLVLNSLSFVKRSMDILKGFDQVFLYLDNDLAGKKAAESLRVSLPQAVDCSVAYAGYKDVSDYLVGRKLSEQVSQSRKINSRDGSKGSLKQRRKKPPGFWSPFYRFRP